jgi:hypothetical protein
MSTGLRWFQNPRILLCFVAGLLAVVVQSGELGSSDTMHRLQTTHSFWTSEAPVFPNEYPEFGVHGRGGRLYGWYGIGQSLLMLPADIVGTWIERIPIFSDYDGTDPSVRNIFVTYTTEILINLLTALVCLRLLQWLGFSIGQSVAGVLALLFCTTHLHYTQNMMENNYIMLLTLTGLCFQCEWVKTRERRALMIGSAAFGLNLLTRLTTGLDLIAGGVFVLLLLGWEQRLKGHGIWEQLLVYAKTAFPIYAVFLLIDRVYQYYRFGSFFNTYISVVAKEYRQMNPALPPNYPWETPLHVGFLGPLITPEKSIFLFDPLLILTVLVGIFAWRYFGPSMKAYVFIASFLLLAYVCFYARYTVWSGDFAWGDRYVSTAAELVAFVSVPLWLRFRRQLGRAIWGTGIAIIAVSAAIQLASLAFWLPLEIYQMETRGHPTFVIALRFKNIAAFALGKMQQWGLNNVPMTQDPWDYVHITTWNFLPFVLRRVGEAPNWVVDITMALWIAGLVALALATWQLCRILRASDELTISAISLV